MLIFSYLFCLHKTSSFTDLYLKIKTFSVADLMIKQRSLGVFVLNGLKVRRHICKHIVGVFKSNKLTVI